jgi:sugar fermentation stimulation protein A
VPGPSNCYASLRACHTLSANSFGFIGAPLNISDESSPRVSFAANRRRAVFCDRPNRFVARVRVAGRLARAHVADPGRLRELLVPGAELIVDPATPPRRTEFTVRAVRAGDTWVGIDSRVPNRLTGLALARRYFHFLPDYQSFRPEVVYDGGRVDFALATAAGPLFLEVKGCTLVIDGRGHFPDAPTERGRRHLRHLIERAATGLPSALLFVAGRDDLAAVGANRDTDLEFAALLDEAADTGVLLAAHSCLVDESGIQLARRLPVLTG